MEEKLERTLTCEACGASFTCYPAPGACWCSTMDLAAGAIEEVKAKFADCLCPTCLALYSTKAADRSL
jgi:hypothetical protein